jgi:hypothetical protein
VGGVVKTRRAQIKAKSAKIFIETICKVMGVYLTTDGKMTVEVVSKGRKGDADTWAFEKIEADDT